MIFIKTRSKLRQSQLTSNLETDEEPEQRKRKKPRKILESSSDDEVGESQLPRPPPIKRNIQLISSVQSRLKSMSGDNICPLIFCKFSR